VATGAARARSPPTDEDDDDDDDGMRVFSGRQQQAKKLKGKEEEEEEEEEEGDDEADGDPGEGELMARVEASMVKNRAVPDLKTIVGWAREIGLGRREAKRVRRAIPFVSSSVGDGRKYGGKLRQMQLGVTFRSVHWGSADFGFLQVYGKRYGSFFLGINSASRKIYVEPVADKTSQTTARCLTNMMSSPGFERITRWHYSLPPINSSRVLHAQDHF
jgi:hypothetical protein